MKKVIFQDWGRIDFKSAWDKQRKIQSDIIEKKRAGNSKSNHFIFCEHDHVYTLGKSASPQHLLLNELGLRQHHATALKINRGGDITYHGPGQIVGYPILDLDEFFTDVHKYIRYIEETIIRTLRDFDITGFRIGDYTGVWTGSEDDLKKVCAIGVHLSRWVTMHGFALNVNTDLNYFDHIIPCGIQDDNKSVTSMSSIVQKEISISAVKSRIQVHFLDLFDAEYLPYRS